MRPVRRFWSRLSAWVWRRRNEDRLRAEVEEHLAMQTAEYIRDGLTPVEARRQAVLKFGAVEALKEDYRDQRGLPVMETLIQDTRQAIRRLRKSPAFTITTVATLALGIGATTSIFTLVHAVIFKSLAVAKPSELYRVGKETHCCVWGGYNQGDEFSIFSYDLYKHLRDNTKGFRELAAFQAGSWLIGVRRVGGTQVAQSLPGEFVSGNYFGMLGIQAQVGRTISTADDQSGATPVALMSYRLWTQKYNADFAVIGSVFSLNGKPFIIVGVTPAAFFGETLRSNPPDLFMPIATEPLIHSDGSLLRPPSTHWLDIIGRIEPGANAASIEAQMRVALKQWLRSHWGDMDENARLNLPQQTLYLSPGGAGITSMREAFEHWLQILMMVSGVVLLIVCANVANLMLVRGIERRQQTSLSVALGARPGRMVRQALTESVLLSLVGGTLGLLVASGVTSLILHFAFTNEAGVTSGALTTSISAPILAFAFAVSLITGIAFGIAPAWMAARVDPIEALRGAKRSTSRSGSLARKALVVMQAALSLVLLSASGLLTAALTNLESQDFGFEHEGRTVANIDPQLAGYKASQLSSLYQRIRESFTGIPGVSSVALCGYSPLSGDSWNDGIYVDGRPAPGPKDDNSSSFVRLTPGFLDTLGSPVLKGRGITEEDTSGSTHVAVVNEAFVKKFLKGEDPIGKRVGRSEIGASRQYEIVGVVKDVRYLTYNLDKPVGAFFYMPEAQYDTFPNRAFTEGDVRSHFLHDIVIRMRPGAVLNVADVRRALAAVDPNLPVISIRTMREQVSAQFTQQRLLARLTSFFGILSLVLASIGLYGVTAYNAGRRVNEIGVRMALGAGQRQVIALVLRGALGLVLLGLFVGVPMTLAAGRFLGSQVVRDEPLQPESQLVVRDRAGSRGGYVGVHSGVARQSHFALGSAQGGVRT